MTIIRKNFVISILRESLIIIYVLVINSCNIAYGQEYYFRHGGKNKVPYKHKYGFCIRKEKNTLKPRKKDVVNFIQNAYADTTLYVNVNHNIISFFPLEDTSNLNVIKNFQGVYKVVNVEVKKDNYYVKNNHLRKIKLFMYDVEPVCAEEYALDYVRILVFQHKFKNSTEIMKKGRYYKISLKPFMQANCCTKINNSGDTIYRLRQSRGLYTYIINGVLVPYFNFSDYNIVEINKIEQITDKERVTNRIGGGMLIRNLKLEMSNYYSFTSPTIPNSSLKIPNWTLHPDHLGSSSWITHTNGHAVQHLHYLPWGEDFVDQRSSNWNAMYTFSAKEKDTETGYSYFGSRYYNSYLSIWLSVDPMADKYPSLSSYTYCADNPIKLVDPDGEEVEYNSFADWIIVGLSNIFNSGFRQHLKELKKSEETYVFKKNDKGDNSFTTDGDKLFINYSMDDNGKSKGEGQTIFSNLRHETTHAYQFENGEIAFECNQNGYWEPAKYDIMDEYEAHTNQNFGFTWGLKQGSSRERWTRSSTSVDEKIKALEATPSYRGLPTGPCNNENTIKIKDNKCYSLPNRKRPTVGKSYGISTTLITDIGYPDFDWFYIDAFYKDTIFSFKISISKNMVVSCDTFIHLNSRWWLKTSNFHNQIVVQRFRKVRPSEEFIKNQGRLFFADYEVRCVEMNVYDQNFMLCQKFIKVGPLAYSSGEIELPKRRMRTQIKKAYEQYLYVDTNDD